MKRIECSIPSVDGEKAFHQARDAWELAMEGVPGYLRNRLNVHQIASIPAVAKEIDQGFVTARKMLKLSEGVAIHHDLILHCGKLSHCYYYWAQS